MAKPGNFACHNGRPELTYLAHNQSANHLCLMRKPKFVYNEQTLQYEVYRRATKVKAVRGLVLLFGILACAAVLTTIAYKAFPSHREEAMARDMALLQSRFESLNEEIGTMSKVLNNVQERDASAHRMVFGMDPIDDNVWASGTGGHDRDAYHGSTDQLLEQAERRADKLKRQLVLQSQSLDTIINLAKDRETMLASVPSIKPIRSDKLARDIRLLSGFGMRIHPIYKRRKLHTGLDFTAPKGTPIQATGDARVKAIKKQRSGYGWHVILDHGYGYETLYGHMSRIDVKKGQRVERGQVLGLVGSTGTSTAPHLHYEVINRGKKVDPIHYCMDGLSPTEYQELVNDAGAANQSFD